MDFITNILKSKTFWIVLAIIILLVILHQNKNVIASRIKRLFGTKEGDYGNTQIDPETNKIVTITSARKKELINLANELYKYLDSWGYSSDTNELLNKINILNDDEFDYFAKYFNNSLGNLYEMIDDKYMPMYDSDELTMSKLKQHNFE